MRFLSKTHGSCGSDDPIDGRSDHEESDCDHLRVSRYRRGPATNGWDHRARERVATNFKLDLAEMEGRHHLTFDTYEEGKLTLEEYLSRTVFYEQRPFTQAQFRRFMFAQSKPYPEMIQLFARLKVRHGLKISWSATKGGN